MIHCCPILLWPFYAYDYDSDPTAALNPALCWEQSRHTSIPHNSLMMREVLALPAPQMINLKFSLLPGPITTHTSPGRGEGMVVRKGESRLL